MEFGEQPLHIQQAPFEHVTMSSRVWGEALVYRHPTPPLPYLCSPPHPTAKDTGWLVCTAPPLFLGSQEPQVRSGA